MLCSIVIEIRFLQPRALTKFAFFARLQAKKARRVRLRNPNETATDFRPGVLPISCGQSVSDSPSISTRRVICTIFSSKMTNHRNMRLLFRQDPPRLVATLEVDESRYPCHTNARAGQSP